MLDPEYATVASPSLLRHFFRAQPHGAHMVSGHLQGELLKLLTRYVDRREKSLRSSVRLLAGLTALGKACCVLHRLVMLNVPMLKVQITFQKLI